MVCGQMQEERHCLMMELLSKKEAELKNLANFHPIHIKEKKKKREH